MKPEISIINDLNEENPHEVYLCDDATKVIKGNTARVGKPIIYVLLGHHLIMDFVILAQVLALYHMHYILIKADIDPIEMEETYMTI
jgi:hypothetical protein